MRKRTVHVRISPEFHNLWERARKTYSKRLGRDISNIDVTRIWAKNPDKFLQGDFIQKRTRRRNVKKQKR